MTNPNLVPTTITDVNGKVTTVHKRSQRASAGRKSLPAPALAKSSTVRSAGTLLPVPPLLTTSELKEFITADVLPTISHTGISNQELLTNRLSREDVSLMKAMIDDGRMSAKAVKLLATGTNAHPDRPNVHNAFLLAESVTQSPLLYMDKDNAGNLFLTTFAVDGLFQHNRELGRISTEEELASYTAVVEFVLCQVGLSGNKTMIGIRDTRRKDHNGVATPRMFVTNPHLEALIKERPSEVGTIASYVNERGMSDTAKRPVQELRKYLDDTASARVLREGWL